MFQTVCDRGGDTTRLNQNNFSHPNYKFRVEVHYVSKNNILSNKLRRGRLNGQII